MILALEADFLTWEPGNVRYAHDFAQQRRVLNESRAMNRLYVVESTLSLVGAIADHRLPVRPSAVAGVARVVAHALGTMAARDATTEQLAVPLEQGERSGRDIVREYWRRQYQGLC